MRILLLNDLGAPVGGAELVTLGLRDEFRNRGHDARVFSSSVGSGRAGYFADYQCFGTTGALRTLNRVVNISAAQGLRRVLADFDPDVVHVRMCLTQLSPLILPLLRQVPAVYHAAWYEAICPTGLKLLPDGRVCQYQAGRACRQHCLSRRAWVPLMGQRALWRRWHGAFDRIVANSAVMARALEADGVHPVRVIWNGVAVQSARPPLTAPPIVSYAGRLTRQKGVDLLIRAFGDVARVLPDARLLIAGEGEAHRELGLLIGDLGLQERVDLLGYLPRADLEKRLGSAWVHVMPSRSAEPFGVSGAEAMMRGTAVVTTPLAGLAEVIEDGTSGLLILPDDTTRLADGLLAILGDSERAEAMGRAGRDVAMAKLRRDVIADEFLDLFDEICSPSAGATGDGAGR